MRTTKALVCMAALAAGLASSMAQSNVYSLNVVGYVNVSLQAGKLHFLSLPLKPSDGNYNINATMTLDDSQDQAILFNWVGTKWNLDPPVWYGGQPAGQGWNTSTEQPATTTIPQGQGFFIASKANSTLTFVGEVPQSTVAPISYNIPTGLSTLANKVPVAARFPGLDVGNNGDTIFTWVQANQAWLLDAWNFYDGAGWATSAQDPNTLDGPMLNPAEGVFYVNTAGALPFTRTFTVQ